MNIGNAFKAGPCSAAGVSALVGTRVVENAASDLGTASYIVYSVASTPDLAMDGETGIEQGTITAQCWAPSAIAANNIAAALRAAIADYDESTPSVNATVLQQDSAFDEATSFDCVTLTIEWWQQ